MIKDLILFLGVLAVILIHVEGHGMVLDPVNRGSRWRYNESAPINFDDNGFFCGGYMVQWNENDGKCGLCGDNYADPTPRHSELGGSIFGEGIIVKNYPRGGKMPVAVQVTANHLGYFKFNLCNLDEFKGESEECFESVPLYLDNGDDKFYIDERVALFNMTLQLPEKINCKHCVLQWTWNTGNSWGKCEDGSIQQGCGWQENFRTCSDISIY